MPPGAPRIKGEVIWAGLISLGPTEATRLPGRPDEAMSGTEAAGGPGHQAGSGAGGVSSRIWTVIRTPRLACSGVTVWS